MLSGDYAVKIACDWNVPASGSWLCDLLRVKQSFLARYQVQEAGGRTHLEYWIPADELDDFNTAIVGSIEVAQRSP